MLPFMLHAALLHAFRCRVRVRFQSHATIVALYLVVLGASSLHLSTGL
jgi:hypothetical protein